MKSELKGHAESHEKDADIREQPAGVANHLENGGGFVGGKGGLIESESFVPKRVVHVDECLLIFCRVGVVGDYFA